MARRYGFGEIADDLDEAPVYMQDPRTGDIRIEPASDYVGDSLFTDTQGAVIRGLQFGADRKVSAGVRDDVNRDRRSSAMSQQAQQVQGLDQFVQKFNRAHPKGWIDQTRGDPRFAPYNIDAEKAAHPLAGLPEITYMDSSDDVFEAGPSVTRGLYDAMMRGPQKQRDYAASSQPASSRPSEGFARAKPPSRESSFRTPPGARAYDIQDVEERKTVQEFMQAGSAVGGEAQEVDNGPGGLGYVPDAFRAAPPSSAWRGIPSIDASLLPKVAPLNYFSSSAAEQVLDASRVGYNDHYNPGYGSSGPRQQLDTLRVHGRGRPVHVDEAAVAASVPPNAGLGGPFDDLKTYDDEYDEFYSPAPNGGVTSNRFEGHALRSVQEESRDAAAASPATAGVAQAMNVNGMIPLAVVDDAQTGQSVQLFMNAPAPPDANYAESYSNGSGLETMYLRKLGLKWQPEDAPEPTNVVNRVPNGPDEDPSVARVRSSQVMRARLQRELAQKHATSFNNEGPIHPVSKMYQYMEDRLPQNKIGPYGPAIVRNTPYAAPTRSGQDARIPGMKIQLDSVTPQDAYDANGRAVRASLTLADGSDWTSHVNVDARTVAPGLQRTDQKQVYERESRADRSGVATNHTSAASASTMPAAAESASRRARNDGRGARNAQGSVGSAHVSQVSPDVVIVSTAPRMRNDGRGTRLASGVVESKRVSAASPSSMPGPGRREMISDGFDQDHATRMERTSAPDFQVGGGSSRRMLAAPQGQRPDHATQNVRFAMANGSTYLHQGNAQNVIASDAVKRDHAVPSLRSAGVSDGTMYQSSVGNSMTSTVARADHAVASMRSAGVSDGTMHQSSVGNTMTGNVARQDHAVATMRSAGVSDGTMYQGTVRNTMTGNGARPDHAVASQRVSAADNTLYAHGGHVTIAGGEDSTRRDHAVATSRLAQASSESAMPHGGRGSMSMADRDGASRATLQSRRVNTADVEVTGRRHQQMEAGARSVKPDVVLETAAGHGMLMNGDVQDARATTAAVHAQSMADIKVSNASLLLGGGEAARQMSFADPANPQMAGKGADDPRTDRRLGFVIQKEPVRAHESLRAANTQLDSPITADAVRMPEASIQWVTDAATGEKKTYFVRPWDLWRNNRVQRDQKGDYYIAQKAQGVTYADADLSDAQSVMSAISAVSNIQS